MTTTAPVRARRARLDARAIPALFADWACIVVFVALGKENHGVHRGIGWFVNVWWPLAIGVVVGALLTRVYTADDRWALRLVGTGAIAVLGGGPERGLTDRPVYSVFTIVAFATLCLLMFAWRLIGMSIRRARGHG